MTDKTGTTWTVNHLPCPECGEYRVVGMLLVNETGGHQHTWYVCTFWPSGSGTKRCGWTGYSVPGWRNYD